METRSFVDQMGRVVGIPFPPQRIISLVPSQTEFLASLELDLEVVGITRFCVHPDHWHKHKPRIGGTKRFDFDAIRSLDPDLVIGNKEENYQVGIQQLEAKYPVWMSDINSLDDALQMMLHLGEITDRVNAAVALTERIRQRFMDLNSVGSLKVIYLIWRDPWMAAGRDTFINDMLTRCGFRNAVREPRYPVLSTAQIVDLNPDAIFLSSEPFPFSEKHADEIKALLPESKIVLVDGEMFSWYGSRLLNAPEYFTTLQSQLRMF